MVKNPPAMQETLHQNDPLEKGTPTTPVFLPGEFHGQGSLAGYSPWAHKELATTEGVTYIHSYIHTYKNVIVLDGGAN